MKKAKENWIGERCSEIEENLRKNNIKRAYQLVKDLTTVKQGKATTIQDRSGKCLTEERQILNRWTEYCSELYNYNKPHPSPKQSRAEDHTEQIEATSGEDHLQRTGSLQSRKEYHRADLQPTHSM